MTNSKHTKRALLASVLSVVLCCAMLIGSTFAWFTDSVTSSGNKIQAGNLNIDLLVKDENGKYQSVKESNAPIFNYDKWEPGYTVVKNLKVSTTGKLSLKYTMDIVAKGEISKLADVIDVYYAAEEVDVTDRGLTGLAKLGTLRDVLEGKESTVINDILIPAENAEDFATIALKMREEAGNEYQGMSTGEFDLQIVAAQYTHETDSFDDQYDKDAEYPVYVATEEELKDALANAKDGDTIALTKDIELTNSVRTLNKNITLDAKGNTLSGIPMYITGNDVTVKNAVFDNAKNGQESCVYIHDVGKYVFEGCVFKNTQWDGIQMTGEIAGSELIVNNCTFSNAEQRYIHVEALKGENPALNTDVKIAITNNQFGENPKNDSIGLYYIRKGGITAYNNTFAVEAPTIYICSSSSTSPSISQEDAIKMFTAKQ